MILVEEKYLLPKEKALDHAIVRLLEGVATKILPENWRGATVQPEPIIIYDISGPMLFYEFSVEKDQKPVGRIRASASKILGPAVYTVHKGRRLWDAAQATEQAKLLAAREHKGEKVVSTQLVCYSYPKIGVLVVLADPKTGEETGRFVIDAATYKLVPDVYREKGSLGVGIWSMYQGIPQKDKEDRALRWEEDDKRVEFFKKAAEKRKIDFRGKLSDQALKSIDEIFEKSIIKNELGKSPFLNLKRIDLTLHGQEHCVWCACASGQMILKYHHFYYQQSEIAAAMGTSWDPNNCYGGTQYAGVVTGMEALSHNFLDAVVQAPSWSDIKRQIDYNQPFISCVPHHARACSGYYWVGWIIWPFSAFIRRYLYIYDPWPGHTPDNTFCNPQGGDEYWEDFDVTSYWDLVFILPCTGLMVCQPVIT